MQRIRFRGRERLTFELDGSCDASSLRVPSSMTLELDGAGRARVRLFAFDVETLRITGVPLVRATYAELLWRVAVQANGAPAWWVAACDLGPLGPRMLARRLVRYPVRHHEVELTRDRLRSTGLSIVLGAATGDTAAVEARVLRTGEDWEVPWVDDGEATGIGVTVDEDAVSVATFGAPVEWARRGWLRTGREHRCGVARRV